MSHAKSIFVAGASSERDEVATAIELLRAAGWMVTMDWPERQKNEPPNMSPEAKRELVRELENGVAAASFFWYMLPRMKSEGAAYEFGFFRGLHMKDPHGFTIVSGDATVLSRLYPYAGGKIASFGEHLAALNYLCGMV